jgi:signal peptidase I
MPSHEPGSRDPEEHVLSSSTILPSRGQESKPGGGFVEFLKELPILIIVAFGLAILIKTFLFQAFFIPSGSMENTLQEGDRVFVSKLSYKLGEPRRGDVVVFVSPNAPETREDRGAIGNFFRSLREGLGLATPELDLIKRIVGVSGDSVEIRDGLLHVNGEAVSEPYMKEQGVMADFSPVEVGDDEIFVMGDNRANSQDSRFFGTVEETAIVGRAFVKVWPAGRFGLLRRLQ